MTTVLLVLVGGYLSVGCYVALLAEIALQRIGRGCTPIALLMLILLWPHYLWTILATEMTAEDRERFEQLERFEEEDRIR